VLSLVEQFAKKQENARILDIGCGTGAQLKALEPYGELWGLDPSSKAIEYTQQRVPSAHLVTGAFPETVPQGTFDLILLLDVLEHISKDTAALGAIYGLLAPNGVVIITLPAYSFLWTSHDDWNQHQRRYTASEFLTKTKKAHLVIEKLSYYNTFLFFPIVVAKLLDAHILKSNKSHFSDAPPPSIINAPLHAIFSAEKHFLSHLSFPFGISLIAVLKKSSSAD